LASVRGENFEEKINSLFIFSIAISLAFILGISILILKRKLKNKTFN